MKAQAPAEGILKRGDFGNSKFYHVACSCGNDDDAIEFEVEADETGVSVNTWITQKSDYWTEEFSPSNDSDPYVEEVEHFWYSFWNGLFRRVRLTWQIWRHGYVKCQSTTIMSEQQALNYAETLKSAINDVKFFREERKWKADLQNRIATKLAGENDCV